MAELAAKLKKVTEEGDVGEGGASASEGGGESGGGLLKLLARRSSSDRLRGQGQQQELGTAGAGHEPDPALEDVRVALAVVQQKVAGQGEQLVALASQVADHNTAGAEMERAHSSTLVDVSSRLVEVEEQLQVGVGRVRA